MSESPSGESEPSEDAKDVEFDAAWSITDEDLEQLVNSEDGFHSEPEVVQYDSPEQALEVAVEALERTAAERDEYLDTARRVQAEFDNYRRRVAVERQELSAKGAAELVNELLPVLDATTAAVELGVEEVQQIHTMLVTTLTKLGLTEIAEADVAFDPTLHDAVMSEPTEESHEVPIVLEVLRTGYAWNGRVLRAAMVKVSS